MAAETTIMRPSSRSAARPALLSHLVRTVRQQQLFVPGQHLLVAVSGGPDSVALLSLLHRLVRSWRLTLTAVHCNYGLRGAESDGDESFISTFAGNDNCLLSSIDPYWSSDDSAHRFKPRRATHAMTS